MPHDSRETLNDLFATGLIDLQHGALVARTTSDLDG